MEKIKILDIRFNLPITQSEVPQFRGAVISTMQDADLLFHNHEGDSFRYAYPLIQYKRINGCAAILCVGEGTDVIGNFFANFNSSIRIGAEEKRLQVSSVKAVQILVQVWDELFTYNLRKWIPLNQENYRIYQETESLAERYAMLERILLGNILSFAKGVGVHFDREITVKISSATCLRSAAIKGVRMSTFDVVFKSNVTLPDFVGLGQKVSLGFGMTTRHSSVGN